MSRSVPSPALADGPPPIDAVVAMVEVELSRPLQGELDDAVAGHALVLARFAGRPLAAAYVLLRGDPGLDAAALTAVLGPPVLAHAAAELDRLGVPAVADLSALVAHDEASSARRWAAAMAAERDRIHASAPSTSVIVCSRGRADFLGAALRGLLALDHPRFEIVVVDNDPADPGVRDIVAAVAADAPAGGPELRRVEEPRPGLSWARNRGVAAANGAILAFTDDDAVVDPAWLTQLVAGFDAAPSVRCVTGMTLPLELDTPAQHLFEQFGGHSKARAAVPAVIRPRARQHPLWPFPPYGAGVNMAFDAALLRRMGGFEVQLGAGTPTHGAEDTAALAEVLMRGGAIAFAPSALVRHVHRRDMAALDRQLGGYGTALTAYFTWCAHRHAPAAVAMGVRHLADGLEFLTGRRAEATRGAEFPPELLARQRRGMLDGPVAYVRSLRRQRRVA